MGKCPVCNAEWQDLVCAVCGFDASADREVYPTLMCPTASQKAKSSLKSTLQERKSEKEFEVEQGILKAYHGTKACVMVQDGITTIAPKCFEGCTMMKEIWLPTGLEEIADWSFRNCSFLKKIVIPAGVKRIGVGAFEDCTALQEALLPDALEMINAWSFGGCSSLQEITLPARTKRIGAGAFEGCTALQEIRLPDGLEEIGFAGAKNCMALKKVVVPASVKRIGAWAFENCNALRDITLLSADTIVEEYAFDHCPGTVKRPETIFDTLELFDPKDFVIEGKVLKKYCGKSASVVVPARVTKIGESCFKDCKTLKEVCLPKELTEIDRDAFWAAVR